MSEDRSSEQAISKPPNAPNEYLEDTAENKPALRKAAILYSLANGILLSTLITFARVYQGWWETGAVKLDEHVLFTFVFWLFAGSLIGYLSWRRKRAEAKALARKQANSNG